MSHFSNLVIAKLTIGTYIENWEATKTQSQWNIHHGFQICPHKKPLEPTYTRAYMNSIVNSLAAIDLQGAVNEIIPTKNVKA
jgi:hypothetical protein